MHNTFVTGYSIQGFGVPKTSYRLQADLADVSVDITEASIAHAGAIITKVMPVLVEVLDDPLPNLRTRVALGRAVGSVSIEMVGDFHYYLHLDTDMAVRADMKRTEMTVFRLLTGCMFYDIEPREIKAVLDNNHTAYDIIGGAGTCHYGDIKC